MFKMLEGDELNPLRVYKRLELISKQRYGKDISSVFNISSSSNVKTGEDAVEPLTHVLYKMIEKDVFKDDIRADEFQQITGVTSKEALDQYQELQWKSREDEKRVRDQFIHWITMGIDILLFSNKSLGAERDLLSQNERNDSEDIDEEVASSNDQSGTSRTNYGYLNAEKAQPDFNIS